MFKIVATWARIKAKVPESRLEIKYQSKGLAKACSHKHGKLDKET